jgi:hypothetical protein
VIKKTHEEMLTIPTHKGNANQNHVKIPPHPCLNSYHQEHQQQQMLMRKQGKRNPQTLPRKCKSVQPLWKTVWRLKNLKIELPYDPVIPLLGIHMKGM